MEVAMAEDEFSAGLPGHEEKSGLEQALEQHDTLVSRRRSDKLSKLEEEVIWALKAKSVHHIARLLELSPPSWLRPMSREARLLGEVASGIIDTLGGHAPEVFRGRKQLLKNKHPPAKLTKINKASSYCRARKDGEFTDPKHRNYLSGIFKVEPNTIDNWAKTDPGLFYDNLLSRLKLVRGPAEDMDRLKREEARQWVEGGPPLHL
jgi:hypothetical protein